VWNNRSRTLRTVFKFSGKFNKKSKTSLKVVPLRLTVLHSCIISGRRGGLGTGDGIYATVSSRLSFLIQLSLVLPDGIHGAAASCLAALVNACLEGNPQTL